ncbi:nicotinate-nucleotide--dimethylbenzimidazole phosphoribosyltransferase [Natronospora cellulosivora (SeqCode)]
MSKLEKTLKMIKKGDIESKEKAQERLDNLTKPPGSLGRLEEIAIKLAGIYANPFPVIKKKAHIVMVADHGIVEEGVSAFPQEVTTLMTKNFLNGGAAINVFSKQQDADLFLVDVGMKDTIDDKSIFQHKVKKGTDNFLKGRSMSREEAVKAIEVGISVTEEAIAKGANLISTGEMGIGNTTASTAILAVLTDKSLEDIVGPGTGLDAEKLNHKKEIIKKALEKHRADPEDPIDILSKVGGLEIAAMAGCMLAAAAHRKAVIIDGLISGAAALIAYKLHGDVLDYMFASHISAEPGHIKMYQILVLKPMLDLEMRLGEGTGAVLAINLIEASCNIINKMATFTEAGINK